MQLCRSWSERQHTHDVGALLSAQQASATSNEQRAAQQQKKSALCMCTTAQKSEGNTPRADLEAFDEREPVLLAAHEAVEEEHGRLGRVADPRPAEVDAAVQRAPHRARADRVEILVRANVLGWQRHDGLDDEVLGAALRLPQAVVQLWHR